MALAMLELHGYADQETYQVAQATNVIHTTASVPDPKGSSCMLVIFVAIFLPGACQQPHDTTPQLCSMPPA